MTDPRTTPLHDRHAALGASFTDFGGWSMPVRYSSDLAEHHAVRTAAGLFDISHMAQFGVAGPDREAFLAYALAFDPAPLKLSRAKYTMILAPDGGIIDDLIVTRVSEDQFLIVANAGNRDAVRSALLDRLQGFDAELVELPDSLLAVQGPRAREILQAAEGLEHDDALAMGHTLDTLPYYAAMGMRFSGTPVLVSRTGYTGEDGFEISVDAELAPVLWDALLAAGEPFGLVPAGLASRDTLRLEAGMPLYGHELTRHIIPAQAGLGRVVPLKTKSVDFVGRSALESVVAADAPVLVGLVSEGRRAGRAGYPVLHGDDVVGEITSGALSPTLGHPIAMAFVSPALTEPGTELFIDVRGTRIPATVTALPFYRRAQ
ncbi:glycine cleavage system aminomethyltransferase GcvT [Microbacterium sp. CFH 31415]|uniref:glycine cleavage system aminomethyltransferase GcvT n=1 Tax=Microbacterium sp. CFH 31415 TaxID=2921732 RepID=UPI001F131212|nr:glycine cleavage system aminomethyltransferase GcvT [Microbacterium sp. CFH 31415]MCH6232182.1 glycine cleavage system aminomethyltransferase GcvT [Microbacterium sp. CFH 31415]